MGCPFLFGKCETVFDGGSGVEQDGRVTMFSQEACRHTVDQWAFERLADDPGFVLAQGDEDDLPRFEDRADPHGDSLGGDVLFDCDLRSTHAERERDSSGLQPPLARII